MGAPKPLHRIHSHCILPISLPNSQIMPPQVKLRRIQPNSTSPSTPSQLPDPTTQVIYNFAKIDNKTRQPARIISSPHRPSAIPYNTYINEHNEKRKTLETVL